MRKRTEYLIQECERRITEKSDAIRLIAMLISKLRLKSEDFIDEYNKAKKRKEVLP